MNLEDIKKLGAKKYFEDPGKYQNPYPPGSPEFNEFERGWMQALRREGGHLVGTRKSNASYQSPVNRYTPDLAESAAERYRSRKG